jgi:hypothetical protein
MACAGSRRGVSGGKIDVVVVAWRVEMARGRQRNEARAARTTRAIEPRADASRAREIENAERDARAPSRGRVRSRDRGGAKRRGRLAFPRMRI